MNVQANSKRGFTLIEVILVLAIAALIFLMIFVALPALQASQRDTARKNDASLVSSAVTKYVSSEREAVKSTTADGDLQAYVDDLDQYEITDVEVQPITTPLVLPSATSTPVTSNKIFVYPSAECNGSEPKGSANARKAAVVILLDNESNTYCVDAS